MKERQLPRPDKSRNRQTLIDATLNSIAEIGLIRTSVSEIIARAGLSRGMIHLHFKGKDNLIVEAARFASEQYFETLDKIINSAGRSPNQLIDAVIRSDLSHDVLNKRTASILYELRGAARTNPLIARFSDTRDERLRDLLESAIQKICERENEPNPAGAAQDCTFGLIALLEGLWTDFLLHPSEFDRQSAECVVFRFLSGAWPNSFNLSGAI